MSNSTIESNIAALRKLLANAKSALVEAEALLDCALATQSCPTPGPVPTPTSSPAFPLTSDLIELDYPRDCYSLIELEQLFRRGDRFLYGEHVVSIGSFAKGQRVSLQSTNRRKLFVTV